MSTDKTFTSKLGTTRAGERTRVWIEGARLTAHGFVPGVLFLKTWEAGRLVLTIAANDGTHAPSALGTVAGKGAKPIIDITGARVAEWFAIEGRTHVTVTYRPGRITIKRSEG